MFLLFSYTESPAGLTSRLHHHGSVDTPLHSQQKQRNEASVQEFDSTRFLYQLVVHCYEVLSLWKLLCEYNIHLTVTGLVKVSWSCDLSHDLSCIGVCFWLPRI